VKRGAGLLALHGALSIACACGGKDRGAPPEASATAASSSPAESDAGAPAAKDDEVVTLEPVDPARVDRLVATTAHARRFDVTLARKGEPLPERAPLACYRLARALDMEVVPETRAARLGLGDLVRWLTPTPKALDHLQEVAAVSHDGTIAALLVEVASGEVVSLEEAPPLQRVAKLAASADPIAEADRSLVADYARVVVLDYLAGNVLRGTVVLDAAAGRLRLVDNQSCFRGWIGQDALDAVLDRVKLIRRFPRTLQGRLQALDAPALEKLLATPRHEERLVGPRQLADYSERRGALLSLLAARALQYGQDVALSL
jgi:hypothetical protein